MISHLYTWAVHGKQQKSLTFFCNMHWLSTMGLGGSLCYLKKKTKTKHCTTYHIFWSAQLNLLWTTKIDLCFLETNCLYFRLFFSPFYGFCRYDNVGKHFNTLLDQQNPFFKTSTLHASECDEVFVMHSAQELSEVRWEK